MIESVNIHYFLKLNINQDYCQDATNINRLRC